MSSKIRFIAGGKTISVIEFTYGLTASAKLNKKTSKFDISPCDLSVFNFSIDAPDLDDLKFLIQWINSEKPKDEARFEVQDVGIAGDQVRKITLNNVCLVSYIESTGSSTYIQLSISAQKATIDSEVIDLKEK